MKQSKIFLTSCIVFSLFSIIFIFIFFTSIHNLNNSTTKYEDLIYKEFTIEKINKQHDPEMGDTYTIEIYEDDKLIFLNNLLTEYDVRIGVESLKDGDKIYCYLIETESKNQCVELKSDTTILSLDWYNQIYYQQGILGLVIMPVGLIVCIVFAIKFFLVYRSTIKEDDKTS